MKIFVKVSITIGFGMWYWYSSLHILPEKISLLGFYAYVGISLVATGIAITIHYFLNWLTNKESEESNDSDLE